MAVDKSDDEYTKSKSDRAKATKQLDAYKVKKTKPVSQDDWRGGSQPALKKEEVVNELSKKTLASYIKKAGSSSHKNSASNLASRAAEKLALTNTAYDAGKNTKNMDDGEADDHKSFNRSRGIAKAVDKITKETVETLEDLQPIFEAYKSKCHTGYSRRLKPGTKIGIQDGGTGKTTDASIHSGTTKEGGEYSGGEPTHHYVANIGGKLKKISTDSHTIRVVNESPAYNKYADQVNDAATVLHYRKQGGKMVTESNLPQPGEAPPCSTCGSHRDANIHLPQHNYKNHHLYKEPKPVKVKEAYEPQYSKSAVDKEIRKDKRIGKREASLIHRLLRGRHNFRGDNGKVVKEHKIGDKVRVHNPGGMSHGEIGTITGDNGELHAGFLGRNVKNKKEIHVKGRAGGQIGIYYAKQLKSVKEDVVNEAGKVYDPITKKMVLRKSIKQKAGGTVTRNGKIVKEATGMERLKRKYVPGYGKSSARFDANHDADLADAVGSSDQKAADRLERSATRYSKIAYDKKGASKLLGTNKNVKEEVVNELSKGTLRSYAKASDKDLEKRQYQSDTPRRVTDNRFKGIDRAKAKLAKEEVIFEAGKKTKSAKTEMKRKYMGKSRGTTMTGKTAHEIITKPMLTMDKPKSVNR